MLGIAAALLLVGVTINELRNPADRRLRDVEAADPATR